MKFNVDLKPRGEFRMKFTGIGSFTFTVKVGDETFEGSVEVGDESSGVLAIAIFEDGLEPPDVLIKKNRSMVWKNKTKIIANVKS